MSLSIQHHVEWGPVTFLALIYEALQILLNIKRSTETIEFFPDVFRKM
jgi:hypothetical protein